MMWWASGTHLLTVTQVSTCSVAVPASTASAASSKSTVWIRHPVQIMTHLCGQTRDDRRHLLQKPRRNRTGIGPTWLCILSVEWWPSWCWWGFSPNLGWRRVKEGRPTWPTLGRNRKVKQWMKWYAIDEWYWASTKELSENIFEEIKFFAKWEINVFKVAKASSQLTKLLFWVVFSMWS